ncbi:uncharacterized protein LOC116345553 [Contarinia nasturtii]|uniref:uncharacterized protein LOC116345553 n=1 Tax=Contarinia nasturtii TaxID=265458 RepID=UPI0012D38390|nr:uncharacterized protein LOC116345553 [Contarinia nasturtii]
MSKLSLFLVFFGSLACDQFVSASEHKYELNSPIYTTFMEEFASKVVKIDNDHDSSYWKDQLKPLFKYPKFERVTDHGFFGSRSTETAMNSEKYDWFTTQCDLPQIENKLKEPIEHKYQDIHREIRQNIEDLSILYNDIRNVHNDIYRGLFDEPKFNDIKGFKNAIEQFDKKSIKKHRLKVIGKELQTMKQKYDDIINRLDEKMQEIPVKRYKYLQQIVLSDKKIEELKSLADETGQLNEIIKIIGALKEKLEALRKVLSDTTSIIDEFTVERIKWTEILMDVPINKKESKRKLCCKKPTVME